MIGVVDYEAGNVASVRNALTGLGIRHAVSSEAETLSHCYGIILPGVGAAPGAMKSLNNRGLTTFLQTTAQPLLGICLGMQLLFESSEEGSTPCLGILPGRIRRLPDHSGKIPHMGWNAVEFSTTHPLLFNLERRCYFYFAHSFVARPDAFTIGITERGETFAAALAYKNVLGVQFHPEKSGKNGLSLLKNFDALCRSFRQ